MQVAIFGLSKSGKSITEKLLAQGHEVIVWNSSKDVLEQIRIEKAEFIVSQKLKLIHNIDEIQNIVRKPRVMWSMQEAGEPTETLLSQLTQFTEAGDIIIDCANSNFKDTDRRFEEFSKKGVKFLGIGLAGGVHALENGFCLMVGGDTDAYQYVTPILESVAHPNGIHTYFGTGGAGHFVNMVHSAIEVGMEQAIAEGIALLRKSDYQLVASDAANTWQGGGIVSSFLLDMAIDGLEKDPNLAQLDGKIKSSILAKLALEKAKENNIPSSIIANSVEFSEKSQYDKAVSDTVVAKVIQAMQKEIEGNN